ncbi:MAG TPA: hypothetical protein VFV66_37390 [Nonomuraea sp.]|nr:hypothetical protein [Nonomuraea sp.]
MSSSIAVVTKRAGLTLTMNSNKHRFHEIRPVAGWQDRSWVEDVVVLDLDTAEATTAALDALNPAVSDSAVVVIATEGDGWDELLSAHPDLIFVSLPIMPAALLSAVDRAVRSNKAGSSWESATAGPETIQTPPVVEAPMVDTAPVVVEAPPVVTAPAVVPVQHPAPVQATPAPHPAPARFASAPPARPAAPTPPPTKRESAMTRVTALIDDTPRLPLVRSVAETLRRHLTAAVGCDASGVLVRDNDIWRVAAGEHLRPLEERLQLASDHWLVAEVIEAHHGLIIKDTDIARTRLGGAPLASWPNLMALPVADVQAFVLLARSAKVFTRKELTLARREVDGFRDQLQDSIDVRTLARRLREFLDPVD